MATQDNASKAYLARIEKSFRRDYEGELSLVVPSSDARRGSNKTKSQILPHRALFVADKVLRDQPAAKPCPWRDPPAAPRPFGVVLGLTLIAAIEIQRARYPGKSAVFVNGCRLQLYH